METVTLDEHMNIEQACSYGEAWGATQMCSLPPPKNLTNSILAAIILQYAQ